MNVSELDNSGDMGESEKRSLKQFLSFWLGDGVILVVVESRDVI